MRTIPGLFDESVSKFAELPFLWQKNNTHFESLSYGDTKKQVIRLAAGFAALGLQKGERVALISEGRNDWVISELAMLYRGIVNVPLSIKLEPFELEFRINHSECRMLVVSGSLEPKVAAIKDNIKGIEKIILLDSKDSYADDEIHIEKIYEMGDDYLKSNREQFDSDLDAVEENTYANICYTSGTTADPKGIILSNLNYYANVDQAASLMYIPPTYKTLIILPLDHCFAHTCGMYSFMKFGASLATVKTGKTGPETLKNIPININEVKPHIMMSVPALARNFKKNIENGIKAKSPIIQKLFNHAMKTAYDYNGLGFDKGKGLKVFKKPLLWFYDKILFSKIRAGFGGNIKFFIGGGALLDTDIQKFFYAIGMPMYQGYGLSEASPIISSNAAHRHKMGSSGFLVDNLELKICDDKRNELPKGEKGEIVVKGENVMVGYWRNDKASEEVLQDGWLYTGDLGYLDADDFLYVLGRSKSLLIGYDGEKYSPEGIEEALMEQSPYIDQCMLHNNQDPYTISLIFPIKEALRAEVINRGYDPLTIEGKEEALNILQEEINQYKADGKHVGMFPERWLPSTFAVLNEGFTEANHMMNSSMKMVRGKVSDTYADKISFLYSPESKKLNHKENMEGMKQLFG
ncbi:MAG: AMP-binding protein [Bacteroidales bacterium]|nr:AMP-binding protein [Bacteroidales bacterium]